MAVLFEADKTEAERIEIRRKTNHEHGDGQPDVFDFLGLNELVIA